MWGIGAFGVALLTIFFLVACGGGEGGGTSRRASAPTPQGASPTGTPAATPEVIPKLVEVGASSFRFTPDAIVLKVGEPVQFKATALDAIHTFTVEDLGIDVDLSRRPKQTKVSDVFIPQRTGRFLITCRVHPASRYRTMQGILEVTETGEPST